MQELREVQLAFDNVLAKGIVMQEKMESFHDRFASVGQIARANNLGTTKSSMFEDMDNMLSQIKPIVDEV